MRPKLHIIGQQAARLGVGSTLQTERRRSQRFPLELPVTVTMRDGVEYKCATRDISTGGVFFYCDVQIEPESPIKLVIKLPSEITSGEEQWVCYHGRVARVEEPTHGQRGVAVKIERVTLSPLATA
jgi:hypothetical protein